MDFAAKISGEDVGAISERLKKIPLFAGLTDAQRERIAGLCQQRGYCGRVPLFSEGDTDGRLYLVLRGGVKFYCKAARYGQEMTRAIYVAGEFFGETSLIAGSPRTASAVTVAETTELLVLDRNSLMNLLRNSFDLTQALLQSMARQLEDAAQNPIPPCADNSAVRLAKLLLARTEPRTGQLCSPLTQDEIAHLIGTRRETVARNLARLEVNGCLLRNHGAIVILNRDALQIMGGC